MTGVMLHIAADAVADFPEDVERVERVRKFLYASLAGLPHKPPTSDLLFVLGALIEAFDLNCDEPGVRAAIEEEIDELIAHGVVREAEASLGAGVCSCCGEPAFPVCAAARGGE